MKILVCESKNKESFHRMELKTKCLLYNAINIPARFLKLVANLQLQDTVASNEEFIISI